MPSPGWLDDALGPDVDVYNGGAVVSLRKALNFVGLTLTEDDENNWTQIALQSAGASSAGSVPSTGAAARRALVTDGAGALEWQFISNHHVSASAAIACTKLDGAFGAVNVSTSGNLTVGGTAAVTGAITGASCTVAGVLAGATCTATTSASIGTTPATAGSVRLATSGSVQARNAGNTANVSMLSTDGSDDLHVGATANAATSVYIDVATGESAYVRVNDVPIVTVAGTGATVDGAVTADELVSPALSAGESSLTIGASVGETIALEIDDTPVVTVAGTSVTSAQKVVAPSFEGPASESAVLNAVTGEVAVMAVNSTPVVTASATAATVAQSLKANAGITTSDGGPLELAAETAQALTLGIGATAMLELVTTGYARMFGASAAVHIKHGQATTTDGTPTIVVTFDTTNGKTYGAMVVAVTSLAGGSNLFQVSFAAFDDEGFAVRSPDSQVNIVDIDEIGLSAVALDSSGLNSQIYVQVTGDEVALNWRCWLIVFESDIAS